MKPQRLILAAVAVVAFGWAYALTPRHRELNLWLGRGLAADRELKFPGGVLLPNFRGELLVEIVNPPKDLDLLRIDYFQPVIVCSNGSRITLRDPRWQGFNVNTFMCYSLQDLPGDLIRERIERVELKKTGPFEVGNIFWLSYDPENTKAGSLFPDMSQAR